VAAIGLPNIGLQGFAPKLAKGEIASLSGAQDDPRYFQISVPVQPGNSGGTLVDERGNVVGVVSAKLSARAALSTSGALPDNVNYEVKSSLTEFGYCAPAGTQRCAGEGELVFGPIHHERMMPERHAPVNRQIVPALWPFWRRQGRNRPAQPGTFPEMGLAVRAGWRPRACRRAKCVGFAGGLEPAALNLLAQP